MDSIKVIPLAWCWMFFERLIGNHKFLTSGTRFLASSRVPGNRRSRWYLFIIQHIYVIYSSIRKPAGTKRARKILLEKIRMNCITSTRDHTCLNPRDDTSANEGSPVFGLFPWRPTTYKQQCPAFFRGGLLHTPVSSLLPGRTSTSPTVRVQPPMWSVSTYGITVPTTLPRMSPGK